MKQKNNDSISNELINLSYLDYEEDTEFLDLCVLEASEKISELSRQLRTYLNYKCAITRFRYSKSRENMKTPKKGPILKIEGELLSLFSRYVTLLKIIGVEEGKIAEKIQIQMQEIKTQPNNFKIKILKDIKTLSGEIWKRLHTLSEAKIHPHPQLLNVVIQIADISCSVQGAFYFPFFDFYKELKLNYMQLEGELSNLLHLNENNQLKAKKVKKRVRIVE